MSNADAPTVRVAARVPSSTVQPAGTSTVTVVGAVLGASVSGVAVGAQPSPSAAAVTATSPLLVLVTMAVNVWASPVATRSTEVVSMIASADWAPALVPGAEATTRATSSSPADVAMRVRAVWC
ncbi:MAG: hypothetical protein ABW328_22330 [Ilumatobacteraceae bacterium]